MDIDAIFACAFAAGMLFAIYDNAMKQIQSTKLLIDCWNLYDAAKAERNELRNLLAQIEEIVGGRTNAE